MLYSEVGDRLVFAVDKSSFPDNSICDIVNGVYSSFQTRQLIKVAKQEVKFQQLIQELVEPTSEIKQNPLEEDLVYDDTYYLEMAVFELQDTDFLVPMHQFIQKTDQFSAVFGPDFRTAKIPSQFPGVTANDFRGLMKCLYPLDRNTKLSTDDWVSILKLSTKWRMLTLREEAIRKLNIEPLSAIMKVQLGNECKIAEWVRSGYTALLDRKEHFTEAEVIDIGLDNVIKLCQLREQKYAEEWDTYRNRLTLEAHGTSNLIADKISRIRAVDHLAYENADLVTAILDAQSLGNETLMMDAWGRMAKRLESLTLDEVERLTLGIAIMMWEVRLEMRRAAWSLVQHYGAKCDVEVFNASQSIASAFASELEKIDIQALDYALIKPSFDKAKKPAVDASEDTKAEDVPALDALLKFEPTPQVNLQTLFVKSLELRKRIKDLERDLTWNTDITQDSQLLEKIQRYKFTAQNWYTLTYGSIPNQTTLNLRKTTIPTLIKTLKEAITKVILKNGSKLSLDGNYIAVEMWHSIKSTILNWLSTNSSSGIKARIVESPGRQAIDLILPI